MPRLKIKNPISDSNWIKHIESLQNVKDVIGTKKKLTRHCINS